MTNNGVLFTLTVHTDGLITYQGKTPDPGALTYSLRLIAEWLENGGEADLTVIPD